MIDLWKTRVHPSDEELLRVADRECSPSRSARLRGHLAQCQLCRKRLTEIEKASACFADLHEQEIQAQSSYSSNARNLLKTRLSEASTQGGRSRPATFGSVMTRQLASAGLALLLVAGGVWAMRQMMQARSTSDVMKAEAIALPRRTLTPGSTRAVQIADLCSAQDPDNDPPVDPYLEQAVFKEYGVPASSTKNYALDYLISPALGGVDNIQNLWPQPYSSTWNSRVKDQLEDHLHELVCQGKIQLATAQNDIASDWIAAYKRYFNTDQPEPGLTTASANIRPRHELRPSQRNRPESRIFPVYDLALSAPSWRLSATAFLR